MEPSYKQTTTHEEEMHIKSVTTTSYNNSTVNNVPDFKLRSPSSQKSSLKNTPCALQKKVRFDFVEEHSELAQKLGANAVHVKRPTPPLPEGEPNKKRRRLERVMHESDSEMSSSSETSEVTTKKMSKQEKREKKKEKN